MSIGQNIVKIDCANFTGSLSTLIYEYNIKGQQVVLVNVHKLYPSMKCVPFMNKVYEYSRKSLQIESQIDIKSDSLCRQVIIKLKLYKLFK